MSSSDCDAAQSLGSWLVRALQPVDHDRWRELYAGYAAFYRLTQTDEQAERTWAWLIGSAHELEGLVAHDAGGHIVGIAHVRAFAGPSTATVGGYLDDLYIDPAARGTGAADALLAALAQRRAARLERRAVDHRRRQPPRPQQVRPARHPNPMDHLRHDPSPHLTRHSNRSTPSPDRRTSFGTPQWPRSSSAVTGG